MLQKILKKIHILEWLILEMNNLRISIRTPVGGFYNHSNEPNVIRMVSDSLPNLKFGDPVDPKKNVKEEQDKKTSLEDVFYHLQEKSDAKYMFLISIKDIKAGDEITANYNLYTYPKTGIGVQSF